MDQNSAVEKSSLGVPPSIAFRKLMIAADDTQDRKGFSLRDIRNMAFPVDEPSGKDSGLRVLLKKAVGQGFLELTGTNYIVKGHAKIRSDSKTSKSNGRLARTNSIVKGRSVSKKGTSKVRLVRTSSMVKGHARGRSGSKRSKSKGRSVGSNSMAKGHSRGRSGSKKGKSKRRSKSGGKKAPKKSGKKGSKGRKSRSLKK